MAFLEYMVLLTSCKFNGCCFVFDVQLLERCLNPNVFSL